MTPARAPAAARRRWLSLLAAHGVAPLAGVLAPVAVAGAADRQGAARTRDALLSLSSAPRFSDLDGAAIDLSRYAGTPLLLNLWATWCPPCVAELPSLQRLRDARAAAPGTERLEVVALNVGQSINQVEAFLASLPDRLTLPIVLDGDRRSLAHWRVRLLPTTLVFDAHGRLRDRIVGERDWTAAEAAAAIDSALR